MKRKAQHRTYNFTNSTLTPTEKNTVCEVEIWRTIDIFHVQRCCCYRLLTTMVENLLNGGIHLPCVSGVFHESAFYLEENTVA